MNQLNSEEAEVEQFFINLEKKMKELTLEVLQATEKILLMRVSIASKIVEVSTSYDLSLLADFNELDGLKQRIINDLCDTDEGLGSMSKD